MPHVHPTISLIVEGAEILAALKLGFASIGLPLTRTQSCDEPKVFLRLLGTAIHDSRSGVVAVATKGCPDLAEFLSLVDDARNQKRPLLALRPPSPIAKTLSALTEASAIRQHGALLANTAEEFVELGRALCLLADRPPTAIAVQTSQAAFEPMVRALREEFALGEPTHSSVRTFLVPDELPFVGARSQLQALCRSVAYLQWLAEPTPATPKPPRGAKARAIAWLDSLEPRLTEREAKTLFSFYGIASPAEEDVSSPSAAAAAARRIGFPVSLRVVTPDVRQIGAIGGVATDIHSGAEARGAYVRILVAAHERAPQARLEGVLVAKAPPSGVRVHLSTHRHAALGTVITLGLVGDLAEPEVDLAVGVGPLTVAEAAALITEASGPRLLLSRKIPQGERPPDLQALATTIHKLSLCAWDLRDTIEETESTLVVRPRGERCVVVEAGATKVR